MARDTWTIPATRWHAKAYNKWIPLSMYKRPHRGYQENLCHYWRVVLFWSWFTRFSSWFFEAKTWDDPSNRDSKIPAAIYVIPAIAVVGWTLAIFANHPMPLAAILWLGIPLLAFGTIVGGFWAFGKYEDYKYGDASPNIFFERAMAKKHKICPFIEIEEMDTAEEVV